MSRARFGKSHYMECAAEKGMEHIGIPPGNVKTKTKWRCLRCGKRTFRTYRGIDLGKGCSCHDARTKQEDDYKALAERMGIVWIYDPAVAYSFPTNTKDMAVWENPDTGDRVYMSWHSLTHHVRSDLAIILGLEKPYV